MNIDKLIKILLITLFACIYSSCTLNTNDVKREYLIQKKDSIIGEVKSKILDCVYLKHHCTYEYSTYIFIVKNDSMNTILHYINMEHAYSFTIDFSNNKSLYIFNEIKNYYNCTNNYLNTDTNRIRKINKIFDGCYLNMNIFYNTNKVEIEQTTWPIKTNDNLCDLKLLEVVKSELMEFLLEKQINFQQ